jgi:hypothetical protein
MSGARGKLPPREEKKATPRRWLTVLGLILPTAVLLPLVLLSTFWHVRTHVLLELATTRLAFILGGTERRELLDRSVAFSSLVVEKCRSVELTAEKLEVADPRQLVPATGPDEEPHFPATAWRELSPTAQLKLMCLDPAAKLTLTSPDPAATQAGILDRIYFEPGSQVILEIVPGFKPALSLETETPQELNLQLGPTVQLATDFVRPVGPRVPFEGDLLSYRARLPEAARTLAVTSGEHGLVLIVTPAEASAAQLFREPLDLPLAAVELLAEDLEGTVNSALHDKAILRYPDFPAIPAVTIEKGQALGVSGLSQARLSSLELDPKKGALTVRLDGIAAHATTKAGAFAVDQRLTLFQTLRYNGRWGLLTAAFLWLVSTTKAVFDFVKKVRDG